MDRCKRSTDDDTGAAPYGAARRRGRAGAPARGRCGSRRLVLLALATLAPTARGETRFLRGLAEHSPANVTAANYTRCVFQKIRGAACHNEDHKSEQKLYGSTYQSMDEAFALCDADPKCDAVQKHDKENQDSKKKNTVYQRCSLGKDACDRVRLRRNRRGSCGEYGDGCHGDNVFTCLPYDEAPARRSAGLFALCLVATLIFCALILYALYRAFLYSFPMDSDHLDDEDIFGCPLCCCLAALLFFWFLTCAFLASYYGPAHEHSSHGACDPRVPPWHTHRIAIVVCGGIATGICPAGCCLWIAVGGCESAAPVSAAPSSPPPLYVACERGHVGEARLLLENGAEVDQADKDGKTPLLIACQNGHVDAARLLLEKGAAVDRANKYGQTPLYIACSWGHVEAARLLLENGAEVDQADKDGKTPLFAACENGRVDAARLLLNNGAEVDRADKYGWTPLYVACERGHVDAARLVLEKGAEVNRATEGAPPASRTEQRANYIRLSDVHDSLHSSRSTCYIKPWGREIEGATGLTAEWHDQGWGNRKGMVFARTTGGTWHPLSRSAAPHATARLTVQLPPSLRGRRVQFGYRVGGGGGHSLSIEGAVVQLDSGAESGRTPLYAACANGHVDAARLLLDKGAEVDRAEENGFTPLYVACWRGHVELARLLLEKGAEVDRANKNGRTPLFAACLQNHVGAARLLLDKGAEIDRATEEGETPLSIAKLRRHSAVVALLEEPRPLPLGPPRPQRQQSDVQCSICLGPYVERAWTKCNHSFCRECITEVCRTNPPTNRAPCPFCRRLVLLGELTRLETTPMLANEAAQPVRDPQPESGVDAALGDAFTSQGRTNTISS